MPESDRNHRKSPEVGTPAVSAVLLPRIFTGDVLEFTESVGVCAEEWGGIDCIILYMPPAERAWKMLLPKLIDASGSIPWYPSLVKLVFFSHVFFVCFVGIEKGPKK